MVASLGKVRFFVSLCVILSASFLMAQKVREQQAGPGEKMAPTGDGHAVAVPAGPTGQAVVTGNGMNYNGGPVLHNTVPIYIIWYGNWNGTGSNTQTTVSLIDTFIGGLSNSGYRKSIPHTATMQPMSAAR